MNAKHLRTYEDLIVRDPGAAGRYYTVHADTILQELREAQAAKALAADDDNDSDDDDNDGDDCPDCKGTGKCECEACGGTGKKSETEKENQ